MTQDYIEWVLQAQTGTEHQRRAAFDALVRDFQSMAFKNAYYFLGDTHMAEDATQNAFLSAYLHIHKLRDPVAFPGWLRRIVMTQCDRLTRGKRPIFETLEGRYDLPADSPTPEAAVEELEIRAHVQRAIRALPEHERTVTEAFYLHGISQKELAERLQIPVTTVKKRLQYARQHLRTLIGELNAAVDTVIADVLASSGRGRKPQPAYIYNQRSKTAQPAQDDERDSTD